MPDSWDFSNQRPQRTTTLTQTPVVTYLLCFLCIPLTIANLYPQVIPNEALLRLAQSATLDSWAIWDGHYGALLTTIFVHGSPLHILFNLLWLARLGSAVELTLGPLPYLAFFFAAGVIGSGAELATSGQSGIGASGAVYGLFGLMWAGRSSYPKWRDLATRENLNLFVVWGLFCLFATWTHIMNIANAAHGAGFLFGLCIGKLLLSPRRDWRYLAPLVGLLALTICAVTWQPWSASWNIWKGDTERKHKHYEAAAYWYQRALQRETDPTLRTDLWKEELTIWAYLGADAATRHDTAMMQRAQREMEAIEQQSGIRADEEEDTDSDSSATKKPNTPPPTAKDGVRHGEER